MIGTWPGFLDLSKRLIQRKLNNLDLTDDDILHNFCSIYSNDALYEMTLASVSSWLHYE